MGSIDFHENIGPALPRKAVCRCPCSLSNTTLCRSLWVEPLGVRAMAMILGCLPNIQREVLTPVLVKVTSLGSSIFECVITR